LAHYFERTVHARDVGVLKPDPRVFLSVLEGTDLHPSEVAHVGDDPELDVVGARAAGMKSIWIVRGEADWPAQLEPPDLTIRSLAELVDR